MTLNFLEIQLLTDQPTTCPNCGARTEFLLDMSHTISGTQLHKCLSPHCGFEFVGEKEKEEVEELEANETLS